MKQKEKKQKQESLSSYVVEIIIKVGEKKTE